MLPHSFQRQPLKSYLAIFLAFLCFYYFFIHPKPPKSAQSSQSSPRLNPIPRNIWHVSFNYSPFPRLGESVQSWVMQNQDYSYTLLSKEGAEDFVKQHYSQRRKIAQTFLDLEYPIFRAGL